MTFPVIDGKKLTSVIITGGNSKEKNCYLTDADGVKISDTATASTTAPVTLTPYAGKTATSLYNSSSTLYISKLVLVYE